MVKHIYKVHYINDDGKLACHTKIVTKDLLTTNKIEQITCKTCIRQLNLISYPTATVSYRLPLEVVNEAINLANKNGVKMSVILRKAVLIGLGIDPEK